MRRNIFGPLFIAAMVILPSMAFAGETNTNSYLKSSLQINLAVPILGALQGGLDVPIEFQYAFSRSASLGIKAEIGLVSGVGVYIIQGGFAWRPAGKGLHGFYLGAYGGAYIASLGSLSMVGPIIMSDIGYQWVLNRFVLNLGLGAGYIMGGINKVALQPALNIGFAF